MVKSKEISLSSRRICLNWFLVLGWCALIYACSAMPNLQSELPGAWDLVLRKMAHFLEYAVLTGLFFRAAHFTFTRRATLLYAVLFALTFAATDELHQTFVIGRSGNLRDWLIDALGVMTAYLLLSGGVQLKYLNLKDHV